MPQQSPCSANCSRPASLNHRAATKFIGGHSDVTAGILAVRDKQLADRLYFLQVPFKLHVGWLWGCRLVG